MMQAEYISPIGKLTLAGSDTAIVGLWLDGQKYFAAGKPTNLPACANMPVFAAAFAWLDRYFAGERPSPAELKLCPQGSAFQRRVWDMLLEIPYGETTTYGEIARQIVFWVREGSATTRFVVNGFSPLSVHSTEA